jgi:hypothetical protein
MRRCYGPSERAAQVRVGEKSVSVLRRIALPDGILIKFADCRRPIFGETSLSCR